MAQEELPQAGESAEGPPDEQSAASAVSVLQFELGLLSGAIDSLDRKASLIPPFLVAAAAFLLGPVGTSYNWVQALLVTAAFATAVAASYNAYKAVAPDLIYVGPKAEIVERFTYAPIGPFNQRVVEALSDAVQRTTKRTLVTGDRLDRGFRFAGATLIFLVAVRLAGGLQVADLTQTPATPSPSDAPSASSTPASSPSASSTPSPSVTPAPALATPTPSAPPVGEAPVLPSFELQTAARSASDVRTTEAQVRTSELPSFELQIAAKGGQVPEIERKIIEKGG